MAWLAIFAVSLQFGAFPDTDTESFEIVSGSSLTTVNLVAFCNRQILELLLFFAKNAYGLGKRPDCYMMIRASLKLKRINADQLDAVATNHKRLSLVTSFKSTRIKSIVKNLRRTTISRSSSGTTMHKAKTSKSSKIAPTSPPPSGGGTRRSSGSSSTSNVRDSSRNSSGSGVLQ